MTMQLLPTWKASKSISTASHSNQRSLLDLVLVICGADSPEHQDVLDLFEKTKEDKWIVESCGKLCRTGSWRFGFPRKTLSNPG